MRALRLLLAIGGMIVGLAVVGSRACAAAAGGWSVSVQIAVSEGPAGSPGR